MLSASSAVHQCSSAMCNDSFSCREDLRNVKRISAGGGRKKKEEEIITIMIAITPKSEEKCREPQNCYSSFQNCLCVTDGKKSFLEAWGSFDVRAVCRQPGGEESCRCWAGLGALGDAPRQGCGMGCGSTSVSVAAFTPGIALLGGNDNYKSVLVLSLGDLPSLPFQEKKGLQSWWGHTPLITNRGMAHDSN